MKYFGTTSIWFCGATLHRSGLIQATSRMSALSTTRISQPGSLRDIQPVCRRSSTTSFSLPTQLSSATTFSPRRAPTIHHCRRSVAIVPSPRLTARPTLLPLRAVAEDESATRPDEVAAAGSVVGAIALITGSSVGAGILALPAVSAPAGFVPTATALLCCWALLTLEAVVIAEVNVAVGRAKGGGEYRSTTLTEMTQSTLGSAGAAAATAVYVAQAYTLLTAYTCKGSEVVAGLLPSEAGPVAGVAFSVVMATLLYSGDTGTVDRINRALTGILLCAFGYIVVGGAGAADFSNLTATTAWSEAPSALPILFLSLVYHDLVPVLCAYLGGDLRRIRSALLAGGALPLLMFLAWDAVALSMVPPSGGGVTLPSVDPLQLLNQLDLPGMAPAVSAFSLLAISTSFMGTFLSLSTYLQAQVRAANDAFLRSSRPDETTRRSLPVKEAAFLCTLLPPLVIAWHNSDSFLPAAEFAGAYGATTLYALMPPLMAWSLMQSTSTSSSSDTASASSATGAAFSVFGGGSRWVLASMTSAAVGLEGYKLATDSGLSMQQFISLGQSASTNFVYAFPELASAPLLFDGLLGSL